MSGSNRHAPGSLRAAKIANLETRSADVSARRSDQHRVWDEVERQSVMHSVDSETSALDDVQEEVDDRISAQLDDLRPVPGQIGVICTVGEQVVGMDLFDKPSTLERYLRGIIAGHALDAPASPTRRFHRCHRALPCSGRCHGQRARTGVGLGEEILLHGDIAGIGLSYEERLVHLAAFPAPV